MINATTPGKPRFFVSCEHEDVMAALPREIATQRLETGRTVTYCMFDVLCNVCGGLVEFQWQEGTGYVRTACIDGAVAGQVEVSLEGSELKPARPDSAVVREVVEWRPAPRCEEEGVWRLVSGDRYVGYATWKSGEWVDDNDEKVYNVTHVAMLLSGPMVKS